MMVVAKKRYYRCLKCKKSWISESDLDITTCPCCGGMSFVHRGCGGVCVENADLIKIR